MRSVAGQAIAVVGAASGIGRAASAHLAARGARVICLDRDVEGLHSLADDLSATRPSPKVIPIDVTDESSVVHGMDAAVRHHGRIDALVNCVGITGDTGRPTHEIDIDDFDRVYRANLRGALLLSKVTIPYMLKNNYGRILHLASIAGKEGNAGMAAYSATKAGLIGLVKTLGKEYATTGITVNALAPAVIQTPLVDAMPEHQVTYMVEKIPMERPGTLEEVADMIAWIVSPSCSFTTGFTFDLSGGRSVY